MHPIWAVTGREAVLQVCDAVLRQGDEIGSRGGPVKEVRNVVIEIDNPWDTLPTAINRAGLQPAIGAAEALCNVAGRNAPHVFSGISRFFPRPTERWDMANYGEQMRTTLDKAVDELRRHPESRQAVALITHPADLLHGRTNGDGEVPPDVWMSSLCTVGLQFLVRDGALDMTVWMRSNDAWYGLCYDLFQFAQLQCTVAGALDLFPGQYVHHATSMHLYERHWEAAAALEPEPPGARVMWEGQYGIGTLGESWSSRRATASKILAGEPLGRSLTISEQWFANQVHPYVHGGL